MRVAEPNRTTQPLLKAVLSLSDQQNTGSIHALAVNAEALCVPLAGGGARKCIGDQFALFEATVALAMLLRRFRFELAVPVEQVGASRRV